MRNLSLFIVLIALVLGSCTNSSNNNQSNSSKAAKTSLVSAGLLEMERYADSIAETHKNDNGYWNITDTVITDLNKDKRNDTIFLTGVYTNLKMLKGKVLCGSKFLLVSDITISLSGGRRQKFQSEHNSWSIQDTGFMLSNKNVVMSNKVFVWKGKEASYVIMYADGITYNPGVFSVIRINGDSMNMIDDEIFPYRLVSVADIDGDGNPEYIARDYGEVMYDRGSAGRVYSYDPYLISTITDSCRSNEKLESWYNRTRYVYAGHNYIVNDNVGVIHPNDKSKPYFVKIEKKDDDVRIIRLGNKVPDSLKTIPFVISASNSQFSTFE